MTSLRATVRLQFHQDFTFDDASRQVPYFAALGISHVYASPITLARPGSMHGYDVVDHGVINPALGGEAALRRLVAQLRAHGMGLIIDIVPNHMATSTDNPWWCSVLQFGRHSPHADWFDIDWEPAESSLRGKVLAPFLGEPYGKVLARGDITLRRDDSGKLYIDVYGTRYPIAPGTTPQDASDAGLAAFDPTHEAGRQRLHDLLEQQHYRLAWWRSAPDEINWRRFFEITDLIGVRVEQQDVFDAVHALPLGLYEEGLIDGVRVDHVDGLADPIGYCARLRAALETRRGARPDALAHEAPYLVIEKILAGDEALDDRWQIDGTTGYDFMNEVSAVLHDPAGEAPLTEVWEATAEDTRSFAVIAQASRELMMLRHFPAERRAAARALHKVAKLDPATRDWSEAAILRVLWELLLAFPVYRTYADAQGRHPLDQIRFDQAAAAAHARIRTDRDGDDGPLLDLLGRWLGGDAPADFPPEALAARCEAIRRFQQLTPPLTAKSLEDTAFYRYGRLLSRNEVGAEPQNFSMSVEAFHRRCTARARQFPRAMLATATHDHKRGEDTRARLAVLSEVPDLWAPFAQKWIACHQAADYGGRRAPHASDLYMLVQMLVGAWPLALRPDDAAGLRDFGDRISAWQIKALREAKERTSWVAPDEPYESACEQALRSLLRPGTSEACAAVQLAQFANHIAPAGALNGLSQTLLRLTVPGVPDLYQGTEFWDFSLVDPDNRTPVDYAARTAALGPRGGAAADDNDTDNDTDTDALLADWRSGRIKQAVIHGALLARRQRPEIFEKGTHVPLPVLGPRSEHVIAFLRCLGEDCLFVVVPRLCANHLHQPASAGPGAALPRVDPDFWDSTVVVLPHRYAGAVLRDALSGRERRVGADSLMPVRNVLTDLPVALLG